MSVNSSKQASGSSAATSSSSPLRPNRKKQASIAFPLMLFSFLVLAVALYFPTHPTHVYAYFQRFLAPASERAQDVLSPDRAILSENPRRIIAIGDIHGSFDQFVKVLQLSDLVTVSTRGKDIDLVWKGGKGTTLVQVGDVVDRGDDTILLYKAIGNLTQQASAVGDRVYSILGNHEIMNLMGDLRYVTKGDNESFGGPQERKIAWSSKGWLGKQLRQWDTLVKVGQTLFVHGGLAQSFSHLSISEMNSKVRNFIKGDNLDALYANQLFLNDGPFWYRGFALDTEPEICQKVSKVLRSYKASRMVMGHTPQLDTGKILSRCDGQIVVIDVGISHAYGGNLGALEITRTIQEDGTFKESVKNLYP